MNTLNTSVLALIGISAGTAWAPLLSTQAKPVSVGSPGNQPIVDVTRPHLEVLAELTQLRADTPKELEVLQKLAPYISVGKQRWTKMSSSRMKCGNGSRITAGKAPTSHGRPGK